MENPFLRKLQKSNPLTDEDLRFIERCTGALRDVPGDQDIVTEGERPPTCLVLMEGLVGRYKQLRNGRRQILAFQVPGDFIDMHSFVLGRLDHSMTSITPCRMAPISHNAMQEIVNAHPRIALAFWREAMIEAAIFRDWVVNLGQRPAYERVAHAFCELACRLDAVGQLHDNSFRFPVTQEELGQAVGFTAVHVNRVLQRLRADGLVTHEGGRLTIHDRERLERAGDFEPSYLYLSGSDPDRGPQKGRQSEPQV
jgi:CRP-like cAMP-binding protein